MGRHPGYEIRGAHPIFDDLDRETALDRIRAAKERNWADIPLGEIAIAWHPTNDHRDEVVVIEGVTVTLPVGGGIATPDHHVLSDLVYVVEERDAALGKETAGTRGKSAHNVQVDLATRFIERHGPLWLCDEHGLPVEHVPDCNQCWDRERVSHIVSLAEQCWAALRAAETLRAGRPIESEHHELLKLPDSPPPPLPLLLMSKEDQVLVRARLADPIVDDWRRLESWLGKLKGWAGRVRGRGVFPAVASQLTAACHRDGVRRICKNPECPNDFLPKRRQLRYCGKKECGKSRTRQRQAKLLTCPNCGKKNSAKVDACHYCRAVLQQDRREGRSA